MSVGIIAYYQRMQVCQVKLLLVYLQYLLPLLEFLMRQPWIFNRNTFYSVFLVPWGLFLIPLNVYHFSKFGKRNFMQSSL